jgi:hypothetical protein
MAINWRCKKITHSSASHSIITLSPSSKLDKTYFLRLVAPRIIIGGTGVFTRFAVSASTDACHLEFQNLDGGIIIGFGVGMFCMARSYANEPCTWLGCFCGAPFDSSFF